jgi:hypothetical protein
MLSRVRRRPALALAAAAALIGTGALSGCGGGTKLNGEQSKTGNQVAQDAVNALRGASSAHLTFRGPIGNAQATFALTFKGDDTQGQLSSNGTTLQIIKIGNQAYIKGDKATYTALANAKTADIIGDRWLLLSADRAANYTSITLSNFTSSLNSDNWAKAVTQTKLDGKKVVVITNTKNGSQVYVANTGTPYPLKGQAKSAADGAWTFSDYNAPVTITAPADSLSLDELNSAAASPSPSPSASPTG